MQVQKPSVRVVGRLLVCWGNKPHIYCRSGYCLGAVRWPPPCAGLVIGVVAAPADKRWKFVGRGVSCHRLAGPLVFATHPYILADSSTAAAFRYKREFRATCYCYIKSILFIYLSTSGVVGVCGKGHLGVSFLRVSMCAEGMGCGRRWVIWVLRGTGTASGRPGVS